MSSLGLRTLLRKEVRRFMKVPGQTILGPVVSTLLYLLVFGYALGGRLREVSGVPYIDFIVPGLIMLGKIRTPLGSLDRVKRVVKVLGMVNSADGFSDQPKVVNGFSDLMVEVFGEAVGKHARSAVGMAGLPGNAPVEVEMIVEVE